MAKKPLKAAAEKSFFSNVYVIGTTCFDEWILFYVITRRHYFSWKLIFTLRFFKRNVATFLEFIALKEVRILCVISAIRILSGVEIFFVGARLLGLASKTVDQARKKLKALLFVNYYLNRTCSFDFKFVSIKSFCNEAFLIWLLF